MTKTHEAYFQEAAEQANQATCHQANCGSIIVNAEGKIIGQGYNAPPRR